MAGYNSIPHWLRFLLEGNFFDPCMTHEKMKRNEKNIFCLDCCSSFCPYCLQSHSHHRLLQIRRYVYNEVVRIEDMDRLIDCSFVQSYSVNRAKVVFLKERPERCRPFRKFGNFCCSCDRALQNEYYYCSIACKVKKVLEIEGNMFGHLRKCDFLPLLQDDFDEDQVTPEFKLNNPTAGNFSGSTASGSGGAECSGKKQRGKETTLPRSSAGMHRRKGIPCRAPFY